MKAKLFATAVLLALLLSACGENGADISAYADTPITVTGLEDGEITVTPAQLAELDCVSRTGSGATAKAGTVNAYGPLMNTFLEQYDCSAADFYKIRFICSDGYKIVLRDKYLTDYEIVLAISDGGEPLAEEQQPLRIFIPGAESSKWAYSVTRIELEREKP